MARKKFHLILGVTGSIAAYKAAEIIRLLKDPKRSWVADVFVVMTHEAEQFITPLTLSCLSGNQVYRNMFADENRAWEMPHIQLAQKADIILIAPATANIIGKLAHGIADDPLSCVVLASRAPVLLAPAMNTEMYRNKIVLDNIQKLKEYGFSFVDPVKGELACGIYGEGHLAEPVEIVKAVQKIVH